MARLVEHGQERHAPPGGQLLRYRDGRPITSRRYDGLWVRIGWVQPWVRTQQISMDWIRHTTLTWVEGLSVSSASRSPRLTQAMKTAAGERDPWLLWPLTSAPGCPKLQQHSLR
jgi:hypothetical protein